MPATNKLKMLIEKVSKDVMGNLDSNYPQQQYHNVETNRNDQSVSRSFLNTSFLSQSHPKDASEGIGQFPRLKYAAYKGDSYNYVISPSAQSLSKSGESHQRIQQEQQQQYQTDKANLWRNYRIPSSLVPRDKIPEPITEFPSHQNLKKFYMTKGVRDEENSGMKEQKSYNLLQEVQQPENHLCHQHFTKQNVAAYITSGVESNSNVTEKTIQNQKSSEQFYGQLHPSFSHLQDKVKAGQGSLNPHTVHKKKWAKSSPKKVKVKHKTMMLMLMILS